MTSGTASLTCRSPHHLCHLQERCAATLCSIQGTEGSTGDLQVKSKGKNHDHDHYSQSCPHVCWTKGKLFQHTTPTFSGGESAATSRRALLHLWIQHAFAGRLPTEQNQRREASRARGDQRGTCQRQGSRDSSLEGWHSGAGRIPAGFLKGSTVRVALIEPRDATLPSVSNSDVTPTVCRTDNKVVQQKETPKTTRYLPFSDKWVLDHVQNGTYEQGLTQLRVWVPKMQ